MIQPVAAAVIPVGRVTPVVLTVIVIPVVFTKTAGVFVKALVNVMPVSYTHLTLPTIYSV